MKTIKHKLIPLIGAALSFLSIVPESQAQLSLATNINAILGNAQPELLAQYALPSNKIALRFGLDGIHTKNVNPLFMLETDRYTNYNSWPEAIGKDPSKTSSFSMGLSPGVVFRQSISDKLFAYYGMDLRIGWTQFKQRYIQFYSQQAGSDNFTIYMVGEYNNSQTEHYINPQLLTGLNWQFNPHFSVFAEISVNSMLSSPEYDGDSKAFIWNYTTEQFEEQEQQEQVKPLSKQYMLSNNFQPAVTLYLSYTFSKQQKSRTDM